jgi:hypothetical protein
LKDEAYMLSLKSALANRKEDGRPVSLRGRVRRSAAPVFERSVKSRHTSGLKYFKPAMHYLLVAPIDLITNNSRRVLHCPMTCTTVHIGSTSLANFR